MSVRCVLSLLAEARPAAPAAALGAPAGCVSGGSGGPPGSCQPWVLPPLRVKGHIQARQPEFVQDPFTLRACSEDKLVRWRRCACAPAAAAPTAQPVRSQLATKPPAADGCYPAERPSPAAAHLREATRALPRSLCTKCSIMRAAAATGRPMACAAAGLSSHQPREPLPSSARSSAGARSCTRCVEYHTQHLQPGSTEAWRAA